MESGDSEVNDRMRHKWKLGSLHAILTESDIKVVINLILLSLTTLAFLNINALHLLYNQTYVVGSIFDWFVRKEKVSNLMKSYDHRKLKRFLVGDDTAGLITNDDIFPSRRFTKSSTFNFRKSSQSLHKNLMPHLNSLQLITDTKSFQNTATATVTGISNFQWL